MLKAPVEKVDNMHNQVGNFQKKTKTIRKNKMENTVTEVKNTFDWLIRRLDSPKERNSELEARSIEMIKTETHRETWVKKKSRTEHPRTVEQH